MANGDFTETFGGNNIAPAGPTYLSLDPMVADVTLEWPVEEAITDLVVASIIDVLATAPGLAIHLPNAELASTGYVALFNNIGGNNVNVEDNAGGVIVSLAPGTVWQIYLIDNSTPTGTWRIFQFGASVSTAVAAALAGSGLTAKGTQLATNWVIVPQGADYVIVDADRARVEQYTGGVGTFTLPQPAAVGLGWYVGVKNSGSGNLVLSSPDGVVTIDGALTSTFAPGESGLVVTDGHNFFVLFHGGGSGGGSGFSYIIINAAGSGNLVLAGAQLNQIGYRFTGVLTGNRHIIVPNTAQEYWVDNETTGAFTFDVGTAAQIAGPGGVIIPQGNQKILQCDGTNVLPGDSTSVSFPISVANGGTGATTPAAARTNLGATTVGAALFTAASVAAALATLGAVPTSRLISTTGLLTGGGDLSADRSLTFNASFATIFNSADQGVPVGGTTLTWDSETTDQTGWHSTVSNTSRLTVPAGVSFAEISAQILFESGNGLVTGWTSLVQLRKNGVTLFSQSFSYFYNNFGAVRQNVNYSTTGPIAVVPGDYFEVLVVGSNDAGTVGMTAKGGGGGILSRFMARAIG